MIAQARRSYPTIQFEVEDGLQMTDVNRWDVIFSNAVFHWIQDHPRLLRRIYQALRPGGQLICEFGAAGNIVAIENGFHEAIAAIWRHVSPQIQLCDGRPVDPGGTSCGARC